MAGPSFQLAGDLYSPASGFGVTGFGETPFGGSAYPAYDLPTYHFGSDNLTQTYRKSAAEIVHTRYGLPVSVRSFATVKRWAVKFNSLDAADIDDLQTFFAVRVFKLLPTGDTGIYYTVRWVDAEFAPQPVSGDTYALAFEIEEILQ